MKRLCLAFSFAIVLAFCMTGCGTDLSDSKYVGTWNATTAEYAGVELKTSDIFGEISVTFESNGKATFTVNKEDATATWSESDDGNGVILKNDNEDESLDASTGAESITFTETGDGTLTLEYGGATLTFEKAS